MRGALCVFVFALFCAISLGISAPQTKPWRIAISGGQAITALGGNVPGYLSIFALHGLPRMRLDESELTHLERLRQFDVVIACWGKYGREPALRTLEQFAQEGGIVVLEGWPLPGEHVLRGKRLGPAPCPNVRFVPSPSPISSGLPEWGLIECTAGHRDVGSIIPDPNSGAIVLARYTDENTPEKIRGRLRDGNQGAPAILYIPYGKGCILYCGPSLPVQDISPERPAEHFICRALEVLSKGELYGRFYTGKMDQTELLTISAPDEEIRQYPAPNEKPQPVPRDYEIIEETAQLQDFCLTGRWPQGEPASILVGYWSSQNTTEIAANAGKLFVKQIRGGQIQTLGVAPEPPPNSFVLIMRRGGLLTIAGEDKILFRRCMGLLQQGALAEKGLQNPEYQPLAPIHFTDDFMREEGYSGEWEIVSGSWKVVTTEGKPETGVNPFNYQANSNNEAISLTGDWFWSDLAFSASVQDNKSQAVGLIAHYKSPQNFVLLKLQFNEAPQIARLQLWQKQGAQEYILAEAPVSASRADWHRLQIRSSNGRLQGWLNGQPVLEARGFPLACGRVGLYCQQGAASFDDVLVEPWLASPPEGLPRREEMYLANGEWKYDVASDTLSGMGAGGARALLPWTSVKNCLAAVRVKLGQAQAAGLLLQADAQTGTWIMLLRAEKGLRLKAFRQGKPPQTLLETALGGSAAEWHSLYARYNGARLQIVVNGQPLATVLDGAAGAGTVGLYARGKQPAFFRDFQAWAEPAEEYLADEVTPQFAGVMDRNSWAGRCGSWTPDPQQLNCLWHAGFFLGPVRLEAGIHPLGAKETTTQLHLSRMGEPQNGYMLQAQRKWASPVVDLTLAFQ